jgi:hypothetical protein
MFGDNVIFEISNVYVVKPVHPIRGDLFLIHEDRSARNLSFVVLDVQLFLLKHYRYS